MKRLSALVAAAIAALLLAVSGASGASAQTPKLGGTIAFASGIGGGFEPACLNPLVFRCTNSDLGAALEKVLQPAFDVDPRFRFRARLVTRVDVSNRPPYTLTYHIRPEARWSDGVPVTSTDFVFTHAARRARRASLDPYERAQLLHVRSVKAVDAKTVRVTLHSPFSGWQTLFPNVLPRHVLRGVDLSTIWLDRIDDPKTGTPIGSGPFLVESFERGHALTLIRNPRYWGPHLARVDRLVIRYDVVDPVDPLLHGDLDISVIFPSELRALRSEPEFRITRPPSSAYEHFAFRQGAGGHPALRNPLVRRALAYSIDRAAIVRALAGPARPLQSVVYLVQSPYQRANWARYRPRPALARTLFARAGCTRGGDGIYSCGGKRLSLRFVTSAGFPTRQTVLTTVQAQLRRVGVEVVPRYVSNSAFAPTLLPSGRFDVALFGWVFDPNAAGGVSTIYGCGGRNNWTGYCSRSVSRELVRASRMLDSTAQARVLNDADRKIASDVPVLPLYQITPPTAVRKSVQEFVRLPYNPFADAENWWLDR